MRISINNFSLKSGSDILEKGMRIIDINNVWYDVILEIERKYKNEIDITERFISNRK